MATADPGAAVVRSTADALALRHDRRSLHMLGWGALLHLVLACAIHLSPDEAHYALYAAHLDWSYFDHPPLVGWLQWPWLQLGGADLLLRIWPMVAWCVAGLGLRALTLACFPPVGGRQPSAHHAALALWLLSPLPHLLGVAWVPDTLLLALVPATMSVVFRLARPPAEQRSWLRLWAALGLCLGLAGLAKYTALLLALGALLALHWGHRHAPAPQAGMAGRWAATLGLGLWLQPGPWLAALLALAVVSPVLLWNAGHDWVSLRYQVEHAAGSVAPRQPWRVAWFALLQLLAYGALPALGCWWAWGSRLRLPRPARLAQGLSPGALSLCFGAPLLLLLAWLSARRLPLPHWAAPAWLALLPWAGYGVSRAFAGSRRLVLGLAAWQGLAIVSMFAALLHGGGPAETGELSTSAPQERARGAGFNVVADLYGWDEAAARARELASQRHLPRLAMHNWTLASRVAWYARPLPVHVLDGKPGQFGLWFGDLPAGADALVVAWSLMSRSPPVGPGRFQRCEFIENLPVTHLGRQLAHFSFLHCTGWQLPTLPQEASQAAPAISGGGA